MHPKNTKIIATVGPQCSSVDMLKKLILAGVNIFRLNFSHNTHAEHAKSITNIRQASKELDEVVAILMDLQGPKIRLGKLPDHPNGVELKQGEVFTLTHDHEARGADSRFHVTYDRFVHDLQEGQRVLIDDGLIEAEVVEKTADQVSCRMLNAGVLKSNKGINLPGTRISSPSLTTKDHQDLLFGLENGVDFVALSFVRRSEDVVNLKAIIKANGKDTPVIAKIERTEALDNLDAIIAESYGLMVARGDLGVELPVEEVPVKQKQIVDLCNKSSKPVIIATQILDSMTTNPRPTRAEAGDAATAVMDGADALMLSAETAVGNYPEETVLTMSRIIRKIEQVRFHTKKLRFKERSYADDSANLSESIAYGAVHLSQKIGAKAIICFTRSGDTAKAIARYKSGIPVIACTINKNILRRLTLSWGVNCSISHYIKDKNTPIEYLISEITARNPQLSSGDVIVVTYGTPDHSVDSTNAVLAYRLPLAL